MMTKMQTELGRLLFSLSYVLCDKIHINQGLIEGQIHGSNHGQNKRDSLESNIAICGAISHRSKLSRLSQ